MCVPVRTLLVYKIFIDNPPRVMLRKEHYLFPLGFGRENKYLMHNFSFVNNNLPVDQSEAADCEHFFSKKASEMPTVFIQVRYLKKKVNKQYARSCALKLALALKIQHTCSI